ncbi:hypothetical protein F3Y22_tig00116989pilonHSYRG00793 [Hibiscus syriacus]|uniref:Reverse transcriptase zinc-binding domain-containing protein n=1 Tax=Hibiscus syriacus TaxID=106335 RepID=A0A6A2XGP2_HIBSY|nr:hypothetical protein F3Y22_tig00116989pilonHSYRG00793 [Hibiscus syriacus]
MVSRQGDWKWAEISPILPNGGDDRLGWVWGKKRQFSISSAYQSRRQNRNTNGNRVWQVIRDFCGILRVRTLLWLICKGRLMTNEERVRQYITADESCGVCGARMESLDHDFRKCLVAKSTWTNVQQPDGFPSVSEDWDLLFGSILWSLWTRRNKAIFNPDAVEVEGIMQRSRRLLLEAEQAVSSWMDSGMSICGGVIRDENFTWLSCFSMAVGICSIMDAELWGVLGGLGLAWDLGLRRVVLEKLAVGSGPCVSRKKSSCRWFGQAGLESPLWNSSFLIPPAELQDLY